MQEAIGSIEIPTTGPLSALTEQDATQVVHEIEYGRGKHLARAYNIPISALHFNIQNGRYATYYQLLQSAHPTVPIDPTKPEWHAEILRLLNGTWEDPGITGQNTKDRRAYFEDLVIDIQERGQERPGLVISTGGVLSGNRRLSALLTLKERHPASKLYDFFQAFIIPGDTFTDLDLWRLEISQQAGHERLLQEYSPANLLLKVKQGVETFMSHGFDLEKAIEAVASDFGRKSSAIRADLQSLTYIDEYLAAVGRAGEYWEVDGKTEQFTEITKIVAALSYSSLKPAEKAKLKIQLFDLIRNGNATHQSLRQVTRALGPKKITTTSKKPVPEAIQILVDNAPDAGELKTAVTDTTKANTKSVADEFGSQIEAADESQSPTTKAKRASQNLKEVSQGIAGNPPPLESRQELRDALDDAKKNLDAALKQLDELSQEVNAS